MLYMKTKSKLLNSAAFSPNENKLLSVLLNKINDHKHSNLGFPGTSKARYTVFAAVSSRVDMLRSWHSMTGGRVFE